MNCQQVREHIDAYLDDELLVETNLFMQTHIESCAMCASSIDAERRLRYRVQRAVRYSDEMLIDPRFRTSLVESLRPAEASAGWLRPLAAYLASRRMAVAAAFCVVLVLTGVFVALQRTSERSAWLALASEAVGDHVNCPLGAHGGERPVSLAEAAVRFDPFNAGLDKSVVDAVASRFAGDVTLIDAHSCLYNGRRFTHLEFERSGQLISLIVTDTELNGMNSDIVDLGDRQGYHASAFRVGRHAVFVISGMTADDNGQFARAVEPAVRKHIESAKS